MELNTILEIIAVVFGLTYLILLIKEQKICWYFGIAGSLLSIFLFYKIKLYSEAILYIYYVVIGVYGLWLWTKNESNSSKMKVTNNSITQNIVLIVIGIGLAFGLGYVFKTYTDAESPYLDAFTSIFSFIASYLEAKKVLSAWLFWIVINGLTLFLYFNKDLNYYFALTVIYTIFSFVGFVKWRKVIRDYKTI
ncbi:nicotinamide riboside transporter PnuC [Aurantibacter sp.]|uniref:nicotinamide riboside transporter PnuC n=1 Tax=Aurantibacter sp. TaxID=2807103 RepID=UPI0035C84AF2